MEQFKAALGARLTKYISSPQITATLTEDRTRPVSIIGAVNTPGVQNLSGPKRLIELLNNKSATVRGGRGGGSRLGAEFSTRDIASFWLLHSVNSAIPPLQHLYLAKRGHPEELFVEMGELGPTPTPEQLADLNARFRTVSLPGDEGMPWRQMRQDPGVR